jgi:benzoyl-CoA reductase/2-hydroxyglutaryl-CoA dehydratase subunit BcrC/BadD/HgdB
MTLEQLRDAVEKLKTKEAKWWKMFYLK